MRHFLLLSQTNLKSLNRIDRSMTDLDQNAQASPRRKFSFKFPNLSHSTSHDKESMHSRNGANNTLNHHHGLNYAGRDRRNFSEEAKNVPDLQVSQSFVNCRLEQTNLWHMMKSIKLSLLFIAQIE